MTRFAMISLTATFCVVAPLAAQEPGAVSRLELSPDTLRLVVGETARIEARAMDASGRPVATPALTWFAGWENARVDDTGTLEAINPGTTVAGAAVPGAVDSAGRPVVARIAVVVTAADPASVRVALPDRSPLPDGPLPAGSFLRLAPVALDSLGNELWDEPVRLSSSDPALVRVVGHAVTLLAPGTATLEARVGETATRVPLTVVPAPAGPLRLAADKARVATGEAVALTLTAGDRKVAWPQWWISPGGSASVEADDYFVAEEPGEYEVAATFGDRRAAVTIHVEPRDEPGGWLVIGQIASPARTSDLWVFTGKDGRDYAYFGTFAAQMRAYDVTDPTHPVFTDSVLVDGRRVNDVKVNADASLAVITLENDPARHNGIVILDLDDPAHPRIVTHYFEGLTGGIHNTYIVGDLVYAVNDGTRDLHIVDISDPRAPREVGRWGLDTERKALHDVWITDGLAYLSYWDDGLVILDVGKGIAGGTPTSPRLVSRIDYPNGNTHAAWPWKNYVLVGDEIFPQRYSPDAISDPRGYLHVIDVADPFHPREVGKYEVPEGGTHNMWVHDDVLFQGYYQRGLRAVDLSGGPLRGDLYRQGREIDYFLTETSEAAKAAAPDQVNRTNVWGAIWFKGYVYVIDTNSGLWIMKLDRPAKDKEVALGYHLRATTPRRSSKGAR